MLKKIIKQIIKKMTKSNKKWNSIIDVSTKPITFDDIDYTSKKKINVTKNKIIDWLTKGGLTEYTGKHLHKKGIEFFFSSYILDINKSDSVLDAAGGRSSYLNAIRENHLVRNLYLTDHIYHGIKEKNDGIKVVGGDISSIHLSDNSIMKIACHHAFEHFQEQKDIDFIQEAYRILKKNGVLVIIPLFLTDKYIECWNVETKLHFDKSSISIFDRTASIPGASDDGHFARFYDNNALFKRIILPAKKNGFECEIIECEIDGQCIPDMKNNFGSIINKPTRALKFIKV